MNVGSDFAESQDSHGILRIVDDAVQLRRSSEFAGLKDKRLRVGHH